MIHPCDYMEKHGVRSGRYSLAVFKSRRQNTEDDEHHDVWVILLSEKLVLDPDLMNPSSLISLTVSTQFILFCPALLLDEGLGLCFQAVNVHKNTESRGTAPLLLCTG